MSKSKAMTAVHLKAIKDTFEPGIVYHFGETDKVNEVVKVVDKYNRDLDYGMPSDGTAFIRINTTVKRDKNSQPWAINGGAMTYDSIGKEVEVSIANVLSLNPDHHLAKQLLNVNIVNEWGRYVIVFELYLDLELK